VRYNPTGRPGEDGYDESKTLVGCLTAAHTLQATLILENGIVLEPLAQKRQGGFSFVGGGAGKAWSKEEREDWRKQGADWRFIGVAFEGEPITMSNVEALVGVKPYWLEYQNAPNAVVGGALHNIYYLNGNNPHLSRAEREMQRELHDGQVTRALTGDKAGMFASDVRMGGGASGSPYYDEEWNLVGIHRGTGVFTGINTVLDGHHHFGGLREDALRHFNLL
jgi:hypothetical protein